MVPAGSADDLDAVDVFEHDVVDGPEDAAEEGCVDAAAVDEDLHVLGVLVAEAADDDDPVTVSADAGRR